MKRLLLTSASLLALLAAAPTASATTFLFSGAIVDFTIPVAGTYRITAFGAQGGSSGTGVDLVHGGGGAEIRGDFVLAKGGVLEIAVGGMGGSSPSPSSSGGGGGGSFVIGPGNNPLVIAGGGGGAGGGDLNVAHEGGYGGLTSTDGGDGFGTLIHRGVGGSSGAGGGGGGFKSSGSDGKTSGGGGAGGLLGLNGGAGNSGGGNGGFGAGGGGGVTNVAPSYNIGGGGGGGGYSGGGGGQGAYNNDLVYYGGGGVGAVRSAAERTSSCRATSGLGMARS